MTRFQRGQNFRMRKLNAGVVAGSLVGIQNKAFAVVELDRAFGERAQPKLGALKVDPNANRAALARLDVANGLDQFAHLVVRGVAHIDAEDVGAGLEQAADHCAVGRCRAKRCKDLDAAQTSHGLLPGAAAGGRPDAPGGAPPGELDIPGAPPGELDMPGAPPGELDMPGRFPGPPGPTVPGIPGTRCAGCCSLDSVSCTVQARCSPVSTSKKPVRSNPRARQFSVPLMVNSLSREHMKACPDHSPPRS